MRGSGGSAAARKSGYSPEWSRRNRQGAEWIRHPPDLAPAGETHVRLHRHEPSAGEEVFTERCAQRRMSRISRSLILTELVMFEVGLEMNMSCWREELDLQAGGAAGARAQIRVWIHNRMVTG